MQTFKPQFLKDLFFNHGELEELTKSATHENMGVPEDQKFLPMDIVKNMFDHIELGTPLDTYHIKNIINRRADREEEALITPVASELQNSRILFSMALAWPHGSKWSTGQDGRDGVKYYANCITDVIRHLGKEFTRASFRIHVHPSLGINLIQTLTNVWSTAFQSNNYDPSNGESLEVMYCEEEYHPMVPVAERCIPLIDSDAADYDQIVCVIDSHDDPKEQTAAIKQLLFDIEQSEQSGNKKTAAFTFWPGLPPSTRPGHLPIPPPFRLINVLCTREELQAEPNLNWNIDCGLLITLPKFREEMYVINKDEFVSGAYRTYLTLCHMNFQWDNTKGTDEEVLSRFLFGEDKTTTYRRAKLCLNKACLREHTLSTRQSNPTDQFTDTDFVPPEYAYYKSNNVNEPFVYNTEVESIEPTGDKRIFKEDLSEFVRSDILLSADWVGEMQSINAFTKAQLFVEYIKSSSRMCNSVSWHIMTVRPGAEAQPFHTDGDNQKCYFTIIFPLHGEPLTNGTEFGGNVMHRGTEQSIIFKTKGGVVVFSGNVMHRGMKNESPTDFRMFLFAAIYSEEDMNNQSSSALNLVKKLQQNGF